MRLNNYRILLILVHTPILRVFCRVRLFSTTVFLPRMNVSARRIGRAVERYWTAQEETNNTFEQKVTEETKNSRTGNASAVFSDRHSRRDSSRLLFRRF